MSYGCKSVKRMVESERTLKILLCMSNIAKVLLLESILELMDKMEQILALRVFDESLRHIAVIKD